nr:immunoglobulin heavy chain junction region [Macaca mulatta]
CARDWLPLSGPFDHW